MLYDFVWKYGIENNVVYFVTDSIICTKKLGVNSTKLGEFAYENSGNNVYVLQNGIIDSMESRRKEEIEI